MIQYKYIQFVFYKYVTSKWQIALFDIIFVTKSALKMNMKMVFGKQNW